MQYLYIPSETNVFKGQIYDLRDNSMKLINKSFNIEKSTDRRLVAATICQFISEGYSLTQLLGKSKLLPSKAVFYYWTQTDPDILEWFEEAKGFRNLSVVEDFYAKLKESESLDQDTIASVVKVLKSIQESIKKKSGDEQSKLLVKNTIYTPKIINERFYEEDK